MLIILSVCLQFYIYLTYNLIYCYLFFKHMWSSIGYLNVLMYVPIVYGFLPEINVFVFVTFMGYGRRLTQNNTMLNNFLNSRNTCSRLFVRWLDSCQSQVCIPDISAITLPFHSFLGFPDMFTTARNHTYYDTDIIWMNKYVNQKGEIIFYRLKVMVK